MPAVPARLDLTAWLIAGRFIAPLATDAGEWRGSSNQRLIDPFTNVLLNMLVLFVLVLGKVKLPNNIILGRILPALDIARALRTRQPPRLESGRRAERGRADAKRRRSPGTEPVRT